jgi:hypothetical protein
MTDEKGKTKVGVEMTPFNKQYIHKSPFILKLLGQQSKPNNKQAQRMLKI